MNKLNLKYVILPEKFRDKNLIIDREKYPSVHIFTDNRYYDITYSGKMMYSRFKKKFLND